MASPEPVRRKENPNSEVYGLMQQMGSEKGFDPIPPDQHLWQAAKDEPPLHRVWAWMCAHTIHWGHRSPFAVSKERRELHLEHIEADLEMDEGNVRRVWREGVARGLWRNGTDEEGARKLFLCGKVTPRKTTGEEKAARVCTDPLPPYLLEQVKQLPKERQEAFWRGYRTDVELQKRTHARLIAGIRLIFDTRHDSRFQEFGLHKQKAPRKETAAKPGEPAAAADPRTALQPILPVLEGFVQTLQESVQSELETLYNGVYKENLTPSSLLPVEPQRKSQNVEAGAYSDGSHTRPETPPVDGKKPFNQLPRPAKPTTNAKAGPKNPAKQPEQAEPQQGSAWAEQFDFLFAFVARIQQTWPWLTNGVPFAREEKGNRVYIANLLTALRGHDPVGFELFVLDKIKGIDPRSGLAKLPGREPGTPKGPHGLGMLVGWARDYAERQGGGR